MIFINVNFVNIIGYCIWNVNNTVTSTCYNVFSNILLHDPFILIMSLKQWIIFRCLFIFLYLRSWDSVSS